MRDYQIPITLSSLQVYHSGGVTMPECGLRSQATTHSTARLISERDHDWQAATMTLEGHTESVNSVAFSADGLRIVSGSDDHTVRIWDAVSGLILHTLKGHTDSVRVVAFSADGLRIVSGSGDYTVRIWDAVSGVILYALQGFSQCDDLQSFLADSPLSKGLCTLSKTNLSSLISHSCSSKDIQIDQHESSRAFKLYRDGWILCRNLDGPWRRMCWLPRKRRDQGVIRACFGQQIAVCAVGGLMTILDFSDV
jgi:WD40 repeat protein